MYIYILKSMIPLKEKGVADETVYSYRLSLLSE